MLFNSIEFIAFLAVVYTLYRILPFRPQTLMMVAASYLFYGWWDWRFLFLMILSTTLDFWTGLVLDRGKLSRSEAAIPISFLTLSGILLLGLRFSDVLAWLRGSIAYPATGFVAPAMHLVLIIAPIFFALCFVTYRLLIRLPEEKRRKACVAVSVCMQLSVLATFKYFNFFMDSLIVALNSVGITAEARHFNVILPVGISFYTFQSLSYAIDIYRREVKPTGNFLNFALFVSFFPQLVAGPIQRAKHLLPQMENPRRITWEDTTRGLFLVMFGLFKKIAIADGVAGTVDQIFNGHGSASWAEVVLGTVLFAIQIYCDFSGYTDVARGVSRLFGVNLQVNFNQPYFSRSPQEFWKRWHISLSSWLSDYLYKPLGGSRGTLAFTCRNLMLTMILGGLWHGAAWNYVVWGVYHGALLSIHRMLTAIRGKAKAENLPVLIAKIAGFGLLTLYGWLLFRAQSLTQIGDFTRTLFTGDGGLRFAAAKPGLSAVAGTALLIVWELVQYSRGGSARFYQRWNQALIGIAIAAMIFLTLMGMSNEPAQFIYFQF